MVLQQIDSAGLFTVDATGLVSIVSSATTGNSIITHAGGAVSDLQLTCTNGSVLIESGESITDAIVLNASGTNGGIEITAGTNGIDFTATNTTTNAFDFINTTVTQGNIINVTGSVLSTGSAISVDDTSTSTSTRNTVSIIQNNDAAIAATALNVQSDGGITGISLDKNYSNTTAATITGLSVDLDKTGTSTSNNTIYGINVDLDNTTATSGSNTMIGMNLTPTLTHAADAGTPIVKGAVIIATGGTNGTATSTGMELTSSGADTNIGLLINCSDTNGTDLKIRSSAEALDFFSIKTIANGATTIETVDGSGTDANLTVNVDGKLILSSNGTTAADALQVTAAAGGIDIDTSTASKTIDIGIANVARTINLGAAPSSTVQTINIGTHATPANAITIGGAASTTTISSSTAFSGFATPTATGGGFDGTETCTVTVGNINGTIVTKIIVDITGLADSGTVKDVIGETGGTAAAYMTRITTAVNGFVYAADIACIEVPATGTAAEFDIDLVTSSNSLAQSAEYDSGTTEVALIPATAVWTAGAFRRSADGLDCSNISTNSHYIYLANGSGAAGGGSYTGGKFIINLYGHATF